MNLLKDTQKFTIAQPSPIAGKWKIIIQDFIKSDEQQTQIYYNGNLVFETRYPENLSEVFTPKRFDIELQSGRIVLETGYISLTKRASVFYKDETEIFRSHRKPFRASGKFGNLLSKIDEMEDEANQKEPTAEEIAIAERQKALRPSIAIDFALGFIFFFIAREFGLLTASLTGSAVAVVLFIANRFTKIDLLGGFAVFGIVMSLISAVLTLLFQDDLFIKLKGTLMGLIGASLAFADAIFNDGNYLGARLAMYMEGLTKLKPRRAAFAMGGASLGVIAIDTPLAFILTTEQWIWYNAFLDGIIGMVIFFTVIYLARDKSHKDSLNRDTHE